MSYVRMVLLCVCAGCLGFNYRGMLDRHLMADLQAADTNLKVADERLTLESTKLMDRAKELEEADAELRSYSERLSKNADRLLKACGVTGASGPPTHVTNAWFANGK